MSDVHDAKLLKGEGFLNRYRITGTLKTTSPLHVGTGEKRVKEKVAADEQGEGQETTLVSTVMKDFNGRPVIPGSALRGVMRHWLLSVLGGIDPGLAADQKYVGDEWSNLNDEKRKEEVEKLSWLELLFGTPLHAGKVEVWDATCITRSMKADDDLLGWNKKSLTYEDTSVAIDPVTGTAINHLLYTSDVVPPGVSFKFNLTGQNLSKTELGLILLALQGFNSTIYPIRVGARGGRDYGRVNFATGKVYRLDGDSLAGWLAAALKDDGKPSQDEEPGAGYFTLPQLSVSDQKALIQQVKADMIRKLGG